MIPLNKYHYKRRIKNFFFVLCFFFSVLFPSLANSTTDPHPLITQVNLSSEIELLEDKTNQWTIDQISLTPLSDTFFYNKKPRLELGFSSSAWWIRFKIISFSKEMILQVAKANIDTVDIYIPTSRGRISYLTGDLRPPENRAMRSRTFAFPIPADYIKGQYIYLHLKSHTSLNLKLQVWSRSAWEDRSTRELVIISLLLGVILAMAVYNLFIFFVLRDKTYIYYVFFVLSALFYQSNLYGITSVLFDLRSGTSPLMIWLFVATTQLTALLFSRRFLRTWIVIPKLDKILLFLIAISLFPGFLGVTKQYDLANKSSHIFGIIAPLICLLSGFICWRKGFTAARYYLLSWSVQLISLMFFVLGGVLYPSTFYSFHSLILGSALQSILLSFALADRIRVLRQEKTELKKQKRHLTKLSITDELTNLYNKRWFSTKIKDEIRAAHRHDLSLSLILLDVDQFKSFNDSYGHSVGDLVLAGLGQDILSCVRGNDIPCRYGGEEFAIILPGISLELSQAVAERIRKKFEQHEFSLDNNLKAKATISLGMTSLKLDDDEQTLFDRSDEALYKAKNHGRNQTVLL